MSKLRWSQSNQHFSTPSAQEFDTRLFVWLLPRYNLEYQMMAIIVTDMLINIALTLLAIFAISLLMTVGLTTSVILTFIKTIV